MADGYYKPFRPAFTDSTAANLALTILANQLGSGSGGMAGMGGLTPPSGFSNTSSVIDRLSRDRQHQEMMSIAAAQSGQQIANTMSAIPQMMLNAGPGLQPNPQQLAAMASMGEFVQRNTAGFFAQGPTGRAVLDVAAGGANIANIYSALSLSSGRMRSGITRDVGSNTAELAETGRGMFDYLYNQDGSTVRGRTSGLAPGEMADVIDYMSRRGELRTGQTLRRALDNKPLVDAIRSGQISRGQLNNAGLGEMMEFIDADMSDPEVQTKFSQVSGAMAGASTQATSGAISAIKELFERDGIVAKASELYGVLDDFKSMYGAQLSGANIEQIIRQSSVSLRDFGYGIKEIKQMAAVMSDIAQQHGLSGAFGGGLQIGVSRAASANLLDEIFATPSYGMMNREQAMQYQAHSTASFASSIQGQITGTLLRAAEEGFADNDEGRRLSAIAQEIANGGQTSDTAWLALSPAEKADLLARGTGRTSAEIMTSINQSFLNENALNNLTDNGVQIGNQSQREELATQMQNELMVEANAIGGYEGDLALAMTATITSDYSGMTPEMQKNFGGRVEDNLMNQTGAAGMLKLLKERAAANDPAAIAKLESLGGTDEEKLQKLAIEHRHAMNVFYARGHRFNNMMNLGDAAMASGMQRGVEVELESNLEKMLAGGSVGNIQAAVLAMAREAGDQVGPDGKLVEGGNFGKILKKLTESKTANMSDDDIMELRGGLEQQVSDLEASAGDTNLPEGVRKQNAMRAHALRGFLDNKFDDIVKERGLGGGKGVTTDKDGNPIAVDVPHDVMQQMKAVMEMMGQNPITMNNVTINLPDGSVIHANSGIASPERGTSQTN